MCRWYERSKVCVAYLQDVVSLDHDTYGLEQSDWLTRGWTLQELLAPPVVEFYSMDGTLLGTRGFLNKRISELVKIKERFLNRGWVSMTDNIKHTSIAERYQAVSSVFYLSS